MTEDMASLTRPGIASSNRRRSSFWNLSLRLVLVLALITALPTAFTTDAVETENETPGNSQNEEQVCKADSTDESCKADASNDNKSLSPEEALIEWIRVTKGMVADDKFRIERTSLLNAEEENADVEKLLRPEFEFYATKDIREGEVLMEIPESVMIGDFVSPEKATALNDFIKQSKADEVEDADYVSMCMAIEKIGNERLKDKDSSFYPYLEFIFGVGNPKYKRPAEWSKEAQYLFWGMLGKTGTVYVPSRDVHYIKPNSVCKVYRGAGKLFEQATDTELIRSAKVQDRYTISNSAYDYFVRHSWGDLLIPLFDMIPHRNGKWKNVEARFVDTSTGSPVSVQPREKRFHGFVADENDKTVSSKKLVVYANRNIAVGEPLRVSYNQCEYLGCEILKFNYTSGNLMADRGFVEDYPRRWTVHIDPFESEEAKDFIFDIDVDPEDESKRTVELVQKNIQEYDTFKVVLLSESVKRWDGLKWELKEHFMDWVNETDRDIFELNSIWDYYHAYTESFEFAWKNRHAKLNVHDEQYTLEGYDDLSKTAGIAAFSKGRYMSCAEGEVIDDGWLVGDLDTFYQHLEFFYETEMKNSYMKMSEWLHSASNFRAHYHESVIHVALQYVEKPKRVAYIGGGDNMVLYEFLKYPDIELVLGMELDQQVSRSSMRYFGTTPAYHDERVEWWYGNGANALKIIPEEYFGSFDLVLVDLLTEVAESVKVALGLNLAEVASLLMKPDGGLIARNEDSPDRTEINNRMARRVVMYDYYDVPRLCICSVNIASNSVDFAKGKRYDHGVETVVRLKDFEENSFTGWSSYYDSTTTNLTTTRTFDWSTYDARVCEKIKRNLPEFEKSSTSSGVLLVIEAENVTVALQPDNLPKIHSKISSVAKDHGLAIMAHTHHPEADANASIWMFAEGYIKMQVYPDAQYVAFDLMLWGGTWVAEKSEVIKQDLVASVGGGKLEGSVSAYKISTVGMKPKKDHHGKNGLVEKALEYYCGNNGNIGADDKSDSTDNDKNIKDNESKDSKTSEGMQEENQKDSVMEQVFHPSIIVSEVIASVAIARAQQKRETAVMVFCGTEGANDCLNYNSVVSMDGNAVITSAFHPFYSCKSFEEMTSCESETTERLLGFVQEHKRLDGFVLDPSVSLNMGKVIHKIFNNTSIQDEIFEKAYIGLAPIGVEQSWRNILLDRFRTEMVVAPPIYKADFEVSNATHKELWSAVAVRNYKFYAALTAYLQAVEEKTGLTTYTKKVVSGATPLRMDWDPTKANDENFFQQEVMDQWINQRPLTNQYLIQMQIQSTKMPLDVGEIVLVGEEYLTDGIGGVPSLYEYHEAKIVEVRGNRYVIETINPTARVKLYDKQTVSREQVRKFSPTEHVRRMNLDLGEIVLAQVRDPVTEEAVPTHWYKGFVKELLPEGILVRSKDQDYCIDYIIPLEQLMAADESPEFRIGGEEISIEELQSAFDDAIIGAGFSENENAYAESFQVGDIHFITFVSPVGSGVLTWDGADSVEINVLLTKEVTEKELDSNIKNFENQFKIALPSLGKVARDIFPRGYEKTVSFKHDLVWKDDKGKIRDYIPHWMNDRVPANQKMKVEDYYEEDVVDVVQQVSDMDGVDVEREFDLADGFENVIEEEDDDDDEDEDK